MTARKLLVLVLSVSIMLCSLAACGNNSAQQNEEQTGDIVLNVFATEVSMPILSAVIDKYTVMAPNVTIRLTSDNGPTVTAMVEAGYSCDVIITDAYELMQWLDGEVKGDENPNGNDCIVSDSRKLVLVGPADPDFVEDPEEEAYYFAAVTKNSIAPAEAAKFIEFLNDERLDDLYAIAGFTRAGNK